MSNPLTLTVFIVALVALGGLLAASPIPTVLIFAGTMFAIAQLRRLT